MLVLSLQLLSFDMSKNVIPIGLHYYLTLSLGISMALNNWQYKNKVTFIHIFIFITFLAHCFDITSLLDYYKIHVIRFPARTVHFGFSVA